MNKGLKHFFQWLTRTYTFKWLARTYTFICGIGRPLQKKIIFTSFNGKQYSDNPRAISEKMHELFPDWQIVWFISEKDDNYSIVPDYVNVVFGKIIGRLRMYKELATSFCFVRNFQFEADIRKRKGQFFIQTFHGDRGFKKILCESEPNYKPSFIDSKVVDLALAGSAFGIESYRVAFRYEGAVLSVGSPRNDKLIFPSVKSMMEIKQKLGINDEKVLLYAPTFKDALSDKGQKEKVYVNLKKIQEILSSRGEEWLILIRAHSGSKGFENTDSYTIKNVSKYPDMSDILSISDMLLTDYSSCICDFALTGKPCIMVPFDLKEYEENSRPLKVYPSDCGLPVAYNQQQLESIILSLKDEDYKEADQAVCRFYGTTETGKASEEVCKVIVDRFNLFVGRK